MMGVVLLSTIYPAMKASKSANPGVARKWKMPQPEGDVLNFVFPFTVAAHDLNAILQFIAQHFNNHQDSTLGMFAASDIQISKQGDRHQLQAKISLAPFDLGIFQQFCITSQESEIPNILEVVVTLERLSGSPSSWMRYNRRFINDLRNQFLVWRSLPAETIAKFSQLAKKDTE